MALFRKSPETAREMGRIVAEEHVKQGQYDLNDDVLWKVAQEQKLSGYPQTAFLCAAQDQIDALAEASGRTYCNDCGGWYLPHSH